MAECKPGIYANFPREMGGVMKELQMMKDSLKEAERIRKEHGCPQAYGFLYMNMKIILDKAGIKVDDI